MEQEPVKKDLLFNVTIMIFVASWAISVIGELHLFGLEFSFKIPDAVIYVLLAILGVKGSERFRSGKVTVPSQERPSEPVSSPVAGVKLCEYPSLSECPLKVVEEAVEKEKLIDDVERAST